jgi:hypothetical protein
MVPIIATHARVSFRHLDPENRAEHVAEVVANAFCAFARLAQLGKLSIVYPSVLARYGVAQTKEGRKVGSSLNVHDVSSEYCQRMKRITVERLDRFDRDEEVWQEVLVEDRHANPADLAASRIDFPAWLDTLRRRDRKIAMKLAVGEKAGHVARKFHLTAGRISQLRRELHEAWNRFHGETAALAEADPVAA